MSSDFQQLIIIGRVVHDAQPASTRNGNSYAAFVMAVTDSWLDNDGVPVSKATHFTVICWNKLAEGVAVNLRAGDQVMAIGTVSVRMYEARNTAPLVNLEVRAKHVKILVKHDFNNNSDEK